MKAYFPHTVRFRATWFYGIAVALLALALPLSGFGALGSSLDSVQGDQVQMKASAKITEATAYTIHELTAPTGTIVREYVSPSGQVFALSWRGPFIPDMRQLLGSYFGQYVQAAKAQRDHNIGRVPLNIQEPGLVVQTSGHMRAYFGRAYDPGLLPAGVSAGNIQ